MLKLDPKNTELVAQKQQVLKENIQQTTKVLNTLKGTQDQVYQKWQNYIKQEPRIKEVATAIDKTKEELKKLQEEQKKAQQQFEKGKITKEQYDQIKTKVKECKASLADLKEEQEHFNKTTVSTEAYRDYNREVELAKINLKEFKAEASNFTRAGRSIEDFGNKVTNISDRIDKLGTTLTTRLTLPILGIATALVNYSKEFETAFTGVEKTVDGTAEQMKKLKQGIKDMSEEIPASTTEISAVAEAAGQLGIQTDNVLAFTKTMINMGNATNLSADEAATTLARFANVTKMSQSDFDKLGSVIVALGNNFATTEAEISAMGMNLASAGTQVGMSQSQIMALATALSSVGLEAQAGGTAFSKVMVNMQLAVEKGGDNLKNFASVAGMTTTEFKKAFKEDATGAIMQFVDGLSKSGERGKSAIKILDDMGITETRLRDALLRSANASQVMSDAIDLGNKAWEENTALTNEADKRYKTLDSRLETTKNKIKNVATNTGDKLTPTFNKLLDKVDDLVDKFGDLNEEEIVNITKTVGMVAAIGPAIKIFGTLGKTAGTAVKGIGSLTQAIGLIGKTSTPAFKEASNGTQTLAKMLTSLTSPAGLATIAITATAGALAYLAFKQIEATKETKEFADKISNQKKELDEYNNKIDETTQANLTHIDSVKDLKDELITLTDENGKVRKGYEGRVSFILHELNEALGTEYKLNGDIIDSYKDLRDQIDETIRKKRAEIVLNAEEEKYSNALKNQTQAVEAMKDAHNKLGMSLEDAKTKYQDLDTKMKEFEKSGKIFNSEYFDTGKQKKNLENLINAYEDAEKQVKEYTSEKKKYEEDYAKFVEGKYDEIGNTIITSTEEWSKKSLQEIKSSIKEQSASLNDYKDAYKSTGSEIASQFAQQTKKNLENLATELVNRTRTIEELGQDEIDAWKTLATDAYDVYCKKISEMSPEMKKKIEETTGVVADYTPLFVDTMSNLAKNGVDALDKDPEFRKEAVENLQGFLSGLNDKDKRELIKQAGIEDVDLVLKELDKGNLSEENGKNILQGLFNGLQNGTWHSKIVSVASGLAQAVNKAFTGKKGWDEHSPSKKMKQFAEYYIQPISDVMKARQNSIVATARELASSVNSAFDSQIKMPQIQDLGKLQGSLSNQIMESTKMIYTTPNIVFNVQELDDAKLQQCFNYINKKFGTQY